ncbi:MAG: prepilin-type N-terminal cleavage/methylation domain-containing protein [Gemmatimonadetes bacterium]|nr:prepilin-type N-terminal cleavage/methylation domain-containing protein [Gemmatimonadota bacterium]
MTTRRSADRSARHRSLLASCSPDLIATAREVRLPGGFGLVELIVALTILSFGLLALTGAAAVSQRSFMGARAMEEGTDIAALVLDSLMREPVPASGDRNDGRSRAEWTVQEDSVSTTINLTVTVADGAREQQLTFHAVHSAR